MPVSLSRTPSSSIARIDRDPSRCERGPQAVCTGGRKRRVERGPLLASDQPLRTLDAQATVIVTYDPRLRDVSLTQGIEVHTPSVTR